MEDRLPRIAVFISGGGSNLQSLIDATKSGILDARIVLVVSSSTKAYGLERARKENIETLVHKPKKFDSPEKAADDLLARLKEHDIDFIALAGYLKLLPATIVRAYRNRITNIHPALLPQYGGKGMYGHHVHEAVIANREEVSGLTIHLVDEIYDNGRILHQEKVPVKPGDTPETLADRILEQEHKWYPRVLNKLIKEEYRR